MDRLVLLFTLTLASCASGPVISKSDHPDLVKQLHADAVLDGLPGLNGTEIRFIDCGFHNAFYLPSTNEILLCAEVMDYGMPVARMTLLHEAGHAAFAHGVVHTGLEELAADEYAAVVSIWAGRREDVYAKAMFWATEDGGTFDDGTDPHPTGMRRAMSLYCLYVGSGPKPANIRDLDYYYQCHGEWVETSHNWHKILGVL